MLIDGYNPLDNKMFQIMNEKSEIVKEEYMPELSDDDLRFLHRTMRLSRVIDNRALSLQRQGRMLTYAPNLGQEATQVGSAFAFRKTDWAAVAFRELGVYLIKGVPIAKSLQYWYGNEWGSHFEEEYHILPVSIPISSQYLHATGIAMATRFRGEDDAVIAYTGDGGTSEGDFHEALNFAAVFKAPIVFVIQNNQYAISVPRSKQTMSENLAMKSVAYGMKGILVDGNDIFAMIQATREALAYAREHGPVLIEAYTYRMGAHTTSDDPTKYRADEEVVEWSEKDPITRLEHYMEHKGLWKEEDLEPLVEELDQEVVKAYQSIEHTSDTEIEDIFKYHYEKMTPQLEEQLASYLEFVEGANRDEK